MVVAGGVVSFEEEGAACDPEGGDEAAACGLSISQPPGIFSTDGCDEAPSGLLSLLVSDEEEFDELVSPPVSFFPSSAGRGAAAASMIAGARYLVVGIARTVATYCSRSLVCCMPSEVGSKTPSLNRCLDKAFKLRGSFAALFAPPACWLAPPTFMQHTQRAMEMHTSSTMTTMSQGLMSPHL